MFDQIKDKMNNPEFQRTVARGIGKVVAYGLTLIAGSVLQSAVGTGVDFVMDKVQGTEITKNDDSI